MDNPGENEKSWKTLAAEFGAAEQIIAEIQGRAMSWR
jgi:hypothetical protein